MLKKIFFLFVAGSLLVSLLPMSSVQAADTDPSELPWLDDQQNTENPWDIMKLGLQPVKKTGYGLDTGDEPTSLFVSVSYGIRIALSLIGIILLVIMVYAGFRWMTAGGNEDQVNEAKSWIRNAVIGLFIVIIAYALSSFVIDQLYRASTITG